MKNILLIGASKGIGYATLQLLSQQNYNIFTLQRSETDEGNFQFLDICETPLAETELPEEIHGLVYFPGSITLKPFHRMTLEDFQKDLEINFFGAVKVLHKVYPALKKSKNASVVLFSTVAVQNGMSFHSSIGSAKGALEGLCRNLAAEWAPQNIRVNCIAPSLTDTSLAEALLSTDEKRNTAAQRHPLKNIGNPNKIAELVSYLLSDAADWMTGQILHIDGGMSSIKA